MSQPPPHNLHIHMYTLQEILGLFDLTCTITIEDLKRAKKKVLMLHPDKSRLSPDYFLFYKKAFDMVVEYYNENQKTSQVVPQKNPDYIPLSVSNKSVEKQVNTAVGKMDKQEFQSKFNRLFEENMRTTTDNKKNEWFTKEEPVYHVPKTNSAAGIGQAIDEIKKTTNAITRYQGVEDLVIRSTGTSLYEDEDDGTYVSSDPFSKLKFDDLRKVHKDQTVFAVQESDINKRVQYKSQEDLKVARNMDSLTPLEKEKAERILREREQLKREQMLAKQHQSNLRTMEYEKKNQSVLSSFLRLGN
jgi:hypothetical protein